MTTQAAFDTAGTMLETCFADWRLAKGRVPVVESEVEIYAVGKYVAGLEATMAANLHWQLVPPLSTHHHTSIHFIILSPSAPNSKTPFF